MNRRRWLARVVVSAAFLLLLDTFLWLGATRILVSQAEDLAQRLRVAGTDATLGGITATGWPWTASLQLTVRVGPGGMPAASTLDAALIASLSPLHPRLIQTAVISVMATPVAGPAIAATAASWTVAIPWANPDRAWMQADQAKLSMAGKTLATIGSLRAEVSSVGAGLRVAGQARDLDLPGLPAAWRSPGMIGALDLDATLPAGLPPPAATAEASARAWQRAGGAVSPLRLALSGATLDAEVSGRLALDEALRPAGALDLRARGLADFVTLAARSGAIAPHVGQAVAGVLSLLGSGEGAVDIPLDLKGGAVTMAGFPLAILPQMPWSTPDRH